MTNNCKLGQKVDRDDGLTLFDAAHQPCERIEIFGRQREILDFRAAGRRISDLHCYFLERVIYFETESKMIFTLERKVLDLVPLISCVELRAPALHIREPVVDD